MLAGVAGASAQTLQLGWNQLSPATEPPGRAAAGMAYDSASSQMVLFGGAGSTFLNDTWVWNGTNWSNVTPGTGNPPARRNLSMAYDAAANQVVMFGGNANTVGNNVTYGDTWLWNGSSWSQANSSTNPVARTGAAMAYDPATQQVILFGGADNNGNELNDTWAWNGSNWSQVTTSVSPSGRDGASMVYDTALGELILFGGFNGGFANDSWAWNGTAWIPLSPANTAPSGRLGPAMAYDATLAQIVIFGGTASSGLVGDTWVMTGTSNGTLAWTQVATAPSARTVSAMAWDPAQGLVLMFSGEGSTNVDDTWTWAGNPQDFGTANVCPGGSGSPAPCSTTQTLTYSVNGSTTLGTPQVVVQGVAGNDFTLAGGGTCVAGTSPSGSCTVNVAFTPQAPGLRTGAVKLVDASGNLLTTTLISGIGRGSVAAFSPLTALTENAGPLTGPKGVVVDAAGDLFVSDYDGHKVVEVGPSTANQVVTIAQSPTVSLPQDMALDGAGNLFIADTGLAQVVEIPAGCNAANVATCPAQTLPNPMNLTGQFGVSVDRQGDIFVSAYNQGVVVEVPAGGGSQTVVYNGSTPIGTTEDAVGDLFVADAIGGSVHEVPAGCTSSSCYLTFGSGWSTPQSVALDAAGDLYIVDGGQQEVVEFPAGCITNACQIPIANTSFPSLGGNFRPYDAAVDGQGNVYIPDYSNQKIDAMLQQFASINFAETSEGSISGDSPESVLFQNIGNQPLAASGSGLLFTDPQDYSQVAGSGSPADCNSTFSLAPGAACNLSVNFQPESGNLLDNGSAQFTDNAVFNSGQQSIVFSGPVTPGSVNFTLTVTAQGGGSGAVTDNAEALNCTIASGIATGTCSESYSGGQTVTLFATANASTFVGWGGACASFGTNSQCVVTMNAAMNVTASFNQPSFGSVAVCSGGVSCTPSSMQVAFSLASTTTIDSIQVLTQGAPNIDFQLGAGSTCTGTVNAGDPCFVNVNFAPLVPGLRLGAVELVSNGNVVATQLISGIGQGPAAAFSPVSQTTVSASGLHYPVGVALDGLGNRYIANYGTNDPSGPGYVTKVTPGGVQTTFLSAYTFAPAVIPNPIGIAVDGAGNLFIVDLYLPYVVKVTPAGVQSTLGSGLSNPVGIAIDGSGNLYIADQNNHRVEEITQSGSQTLVAFNGLQKPNGVAVDAAGDVFVSDSQLNEVFEVTPTSVHTTVPATGLNIPYGLAVDAAGDVYIADAGNARVLQVTPNGIQTTVGNSLNFPSGVTVDGTGNVYIGDQGVWEVFEVNRYQAPSLNFGSANVNARTTDIAVSIQNIGNQTLSGSVGSPSTANFAEDIPNSNCGGTFELLPGTSCFAPFYAQPTAVGSFIDAAPITDNSLNGNPAIQTIGLQVTGTGTSASYSLTVTPIGSGSGTVTDNASAISCTSSNGTASGACVANYSTVTTVTLSANAATGSIFLGWGGACTGLTSTCQVSVSGLFTVTASFAQQNFGSINVCPPGQSTPAPCSTSIPVTINVPTTTLIGAIQVVTQGASGLDFSQASGGTCTGIIAGGSACTVNVNFAPLAPGLRMGAVELYDSSGTLIVTAPVYGIGKAPAAVFSPSTPIPVKTGSYSLDYPAGLLVDAAGNLFIAEGDVTNQVLKIAPSGSISTVGSGLALPQGMAEDGAGNLYIANNNLNEVVEIPAGCASAACQIVLGANLRSQLGVAVDGAGDLFIGDYLDSEVAEIPAGCTSASCQRIIYSGGAGSTPILLTADALGDVFIADENLRKVVEVPAGCTSAACQQSIGVGWVQPDGVAVDAAGNVYVADQGLQELVEVPVNCTTSACQIVLLQGIKPVAVTVDGAGNLVVDNISTNQVLEVLRSQPPSLSFALTNAGSTSSDSPQSVSIQNAGNQTLTGSLSLPDGLDFQQSGTCAQGFSLAPGAVCSEAFSFTPTTTGILTDTRTFADNTLNLAASVSAQVVNLSGIGTANGATGTAVPNVVGQTEQQAAATLTQAGLTLGTVGSGYSSSQPQGSVSGESPAAGSPVNLGSAVNLMIASGQAPAPAPSPLTLENNYFVTGDFASAGVTLKGAPAANGVATGTITIPDRTTCNCGQGVPDGADIVDGYLYWTALESPGSAPSANTGTFLGYPIVGEQIGVDQPNYNDGTTRGTLRVYRANVNNYFQVLPLWNGERLGSGPFTISLPDGAATQSGFPITEGASLVVIYRVLSLSVPLRSVVIYDGSVVPTASTTQTVQGFYDAVGGASGEITTLSAAAGNWNNSSSSATLAAHAAQYAATLNASSAYAAVIFSTPVTNSDSDGILDAWKSGPPPSDFFAGQPGYYDVKTQSWVALPGAKHGEKDLFVQLDYMCGAVSPITGDCTGENLFPSPDVDGNDPLAMVQQSFSNSGITLHLEPGNAVAENECTDAPGEPLCQFPSEPGVIDWKNGLEFSKLWPRNYSSCQSGGDCTARFPYGQKDSYHYLLFGHSLAIPAWNSRFGTLTAISADPIAGLTTITTTDRGPATLPNGNANINYCPSRFTISGVLSNASLNGVYNTASCPNSTTIVLATPGVTKWTYNYATNTPAEPSIGLTSGTVTSISGYSDLGGADSAVTLALWETDPQQDMSKRAQVIAGTMVHEIGHTLGLSHGGLYYKAGAGGYVQNGSSVAAGSYIPTFDINCKPNYQSSMNYLFQLDGVGPTASVAYSNQTLETLTESSLGSVGSLLDINNSPATFAGSAWYQASAPANSSETAATLHCDGTPVNPGEAGYFVEGSVSPLSPAWVANQNITFDGVQPGSTGLPGLVGYNDAANLDLRQVGATGGEFASLANILSFGSSSSPLTISSGGTVTLGAGGAVTLGAGGSVTLVNGGSVTVGSGAAISGGGSIQFNTPGSATLSAGGTVTPGSNGTITLASGDAVGLTGAGTFTLTAAGSLTLNGGGVVTLGGGGTIALTGGGTVTIPSAGGSYNIPTSGGVVTLGGGGVVTLGGGGVVTLGGGGVVTLGGGGVVTLGGGGVVTLGGGGVVTLGGGGTATLDGGGVVTLGGGGVVTLGGGGVVTLGGGGVVTLGGGGVVTLGGGGTSSLGLGGVVTLGAGGTATLGAGGTVTLGAGGVVTLGGGGVVTLGGGGVVTLGGGGTSPITLGGIVIGTCSGSCSVPAGGTVTLGGGGTVTLGGGGVVTLGGGGVVTLGGGGVVTLGGGGVVTLGGGGVATLGGGGVATLGGGGVVTLGGGGNQTTELDYNTANSVVRPPSLPTYSVTPANTVQVNWKAPIFGVVQTYTISRSVIVPPATTPGPSQVIGSVSGVFANGGYTPPATTFTDTNPPAGTLIYTITTTLVPDTAGSTPRQSAPSAPAVLTLGQTIVLGPLPSSVVLGSSQPTLITVTATAESNNTPNMQQVSFSTSGPCSAQNLPVNTTTGVSSATVALTSTGSCTITASQAGNSATATAPPAYSAASPVSGTFAILPQGSNIQSQTITFGPLPSVQYGSGFSVSAASNSGVPVSFSAPANGPCSVSATTNAASGATSGAGLCRITASAPASGNFSAASLTQSFSIAAAPLTVTANSFTVTYGQGIPPLTYAFGPLVNGDSISTAVSGAPALATAAAPSSNAGTYPITVSTGTLAASNYSFYYIGGNVVVMPATTAASVVSSAPGNGSNYMQEVTFTATVVDNSAGSYGAAPTGTVSFYNNGALLGTGTLAPVVPCNTSPCASQAMFNTTSLAAGANVITVTYSGDAGANGDGFGNYYPSSQRGSTASGLTQTVTPVPLVNLSPVSLSFGNVNVGKSSSPATVTLSNTGDAALTLGSGSFQITGPNMADFTQTNNCPSSLGYTSGSNSCTVTVTFTPSDSGVETAALQITDNNDNTVGAQQSVVLTGSGLSFIAGNSVYTSAIFSNSNGCGAITVSGGSTINSFNSSLGYSASKQNSGGNVGSNGNITVGGGSTIYGSAAANVLTTGKCSANSVTGLTTSGGGSVTGGLVALQGPINYPAPSAANPAPPTTSQTISGSCPSGMTGCSSAGSRAVTLAPGLYGNVTATSGTTVHFGAGTYYLNSLKVSGGSLLHVDSGPVVIHLAGASLSGSTPVMDFTGGGMENPSGVPGNLQFTYGGSQGINLTGGTQAYAAVYAPNAPVNLTAGTDFFGSIIGSTVTSSGGTSIHYDTNLPNIPQGKTIWFAAVVNNLKGLPASQQVKLYLTNGSISFTANNTQYTVPVPNAVVTLNSSVTGAKSTVYDLTNNRWSTSIASGNLTGNTFVTGAAFPVPVAFPAGIKNVTWSGSFSTDTPGITLQWQWNAQVYTQFSQTYATTTNSNVLGVNPEDGTADAFGTDPAGTPETYKPNAVFGGTDGYFSAASGVVPTVAQVSVSPSSLSFGSQTELQTSAPLTAVLTNNYSSGFTISNIAVSGANSADFAESDNCPRTSGGLTSSCTISVTFTPHSGAQEEAKIVVTDTANNSPQTVYLSGTGHP